MRYIIRQKVFSFGDSFAIKDGMGNDVFIVRSQILSFGKKLRLFDLSGNELCYIEQKVFRFMPEYDIFIAGENIANVKKKFAFFKNNFEINSPGTRFYVEGDLWAHDFSIYSGSQLIATISKKFFSLTDTYGVEVDDNQDQVTALALAIVIDMVCHDHDD
jgi:uncharacterized protein YxjI